MSSSTRPLCFAMLGAALVFFTGSAKATVIDFNAVNNLSSSPTLSTYSEDGFTLTTTGFSGPAEFFWQRSSSYNVDPDGAALSTGFTGITTTLTKNGGDSFIFNSIDLADIYNNKNSNLGVGGNVRFTFTHSDLTTEVQTVTIDGSPGLETFTFNMSDLISVAWLPQTTYNRWLQVDDIVVDEIVTAVPEPTSLALLSAGLMGLGLMRRRKAAQL